MSGRDELANRLRRIDRRSYRAYKDIAGSYELGLCTLFIDHVQGDPFAAPSKMRLRAPFDVTKSNPSFLSNRTRRIAFEDYLARVANRVIQDVCRGARGSGKSGRVEIDAGGQAVLERTAAVVTEAFVEIRITVGLPASGRTVLGHEAEELLLDDLVRVARQSLYADEYGAASARSFVESVENQAHLRAQLAERGLVAFVADDAILPRASGASDRPLHDAVPMRSPDDLAVTLEYLHPVLGTTELRGLAIPRGITLIVGGGYHGKSTLLRAIERGVYDHVPEDGRERVVTVDDAVKIRAEDGRHVEAVDISPFIGSLPYGRPTRCFRSEDASGSTSQAASIVEALELGASTLLLDEDTSATNFMVRDARMQSLVAEHQEPITPFVDRVRELYDELGVSTVLVMGGCGDYFDHADTVIHMERFVPVDATERAKSIAREQPTTRQPSTQSPIGAPTARRPRASSVNASRGRRDLKIDVRAVDRLTFGTTDVDLSGLEQLIDTSQTRAIGYAIERARGDMGEASLSTLVDGLEQRIDEAGLDTLNPRQRHGEHPGHFARPRRFEIAGALNRLRTVRMDQEKNDERSG